MRIEDMAIHYYLSSLVFASVFSAQVGALLLASSGMLLDLKLPGHRSSPLHCNLGILPPRDGSPSTASSECSSSTRYIWLSGSFSCFRDNRDFGYPLFIGAGYADPAGMTIEKCADFCESQSVPYRFMGITDGFQCCKPATKESELTMLKYSACDNFFEYTYESINGCDTPCPGDPSEVGGCGGKEEWQPLASTYQNVNFNFPSTVLSVGLWDGLGCYKSVQVQFKLT